MSSKSPRDKSVAGKSSRTKVSKRANRSKPRAPQTNAVNVVTVSAASYEATAVAPDSIVAAFGTLLATSTQAANTAPLPTTLAGTTLTVRDSAGVERLAPLFFVSPNQINYLIPPDTATGAATVTVVAGNGIISQGTVQVNIAGPAIFTANADGKGVPAANLLRVRNGQQINESLVQLDPATGRLKPKPIDPGPEGDRLFLVLYPSGLRRAPDPNGDGNLNENVRVIIGNLEIRPDYAGRQSSFVGLDQVNAEIPRSLAGRGRLDVVVTVPAFNSSNVVEIDFGPAAGVAPPQITGFSVSTATAGQTITINGSGFSPTPAENLVRFGSLEATVLSAAPNQLSVIAPFGAETDRVTVRTPQGEGGSADALPIRTSISGYVETTSRQPLAGATVKVTGTNIAATTNAEGVFILPDVPAGAREIEVDGGAVPITSSAYPKIKLRTNVIANRDNQLLHPISLQFAAGASVTFSASGNLTDEAITVPAAKSESEPALIPVETGNVIFEIPSGTTVTFPDGSTSGALALTQLEGSRTPVNLPKGHFSSSILQIAPYGASFSQGGKITFPNRDGLPAEAQVKLFRLDQTSGSPTLGSFVEAGLATVSADGKTIETQAGVITESGCYFVSALRPAQTLIGRVVESNGNAVRRVFVTVRGQETITDGNGGFALRLAPANQGDRVRIDASYLRPNGRVERATRDFAIPVTILPVGFVRITPDLVLPGETSNRPPVILAPTSLSVAAGQTLEVNVAVSDQDSGQTAQVTVSGASFATLSSQGGGAYKLRLAPGSGDPGAYTLALTATDSANASVTQNISLAVTAPPPTIADFNPKSGRVGTIVTLTGASLKSAFGNPSVTFAGAGGARLEAFVSSATATEVRVTVPNGAMTGRIELANTLGRALTGNPFTVDPSQDFQITVAPSTATAVQGSTGTFVVSLTSTPPNFSQLAKLSVTGAPAGATVSFTPEQISAGATSTLSVVLPGTVSPASYSLTISAKAIVDGVELTRTAPASLTVQRADGQTTLSGRVLSTESESIPGATVSLDGKSATTDASGSFLLSGITAGTDRPVMVDGRTANVPNRRYPIITEPITIVAGQTNIVPYTFYLPVIDVENEVPLIPGQNTIVTTPKVPGLVMTIPADANLRNRDGSPVTRVSLSQVEIDRTPAPLPANVGTNVVYTAQPGTARPAPGKVTPVVYPNLAGTDPGTRIELWNFDPDTAQWYIYGFGRVSADGRTIAPEPGVGLPYFSWHFPNAAPGGNPSPPEQCPVPRTPPAVDLTTGVKIETTTDISFGGARGGLELTRVYTSDLAQICDFCPFGRGATHNYAIRLRGSFAQGGAGRVVMPEQVTGRLFSYVRAESDGALIFGTTATTAQLADVVRKLTNGTFEYRKGDGEVWRFDATGRLTGMVDRNGNTTTLSYTGSNLTRITDAVGRSITLDYDGSNRIRLATDPLGRLWQYSYGGSNSLVTVADPLGNVTGYGYGIAGLLTSVTDGRGFVKKKITYASDISRVNRVIKQEFADGGFETYEYKLSGTVVTETKITDSLGRVRTMRFSAAGYVIGVTDELGQSSIIRRDMTTNLDQETTGPCNCPEARREFDNRGNLLAFIDRRGQRTEYQYEPNFNFVTQIKDALGRITGTGYDNRGNRTSMTDALGRMTAYAYDSFGQLISITDPLGHTTRYEYDANGYVSKVIDALGNETLNEYDVVGRLKKTTDGEGRSTSIAYDNSDRLTSVTDPAGVATRYDYDENDNRTAIFNAQNKRWSFVYDAKNRLAGSTDPLNQTTQYRYNTDDEMVAMISPSGRTTSYEYDSRGQRTKMIDPIKGEIRFTYDSQKNLTTVTDQRGNTTTFTYDELYRQIAQRDPLGLTTTSAYDPVGNLIEKVDRLNRRIRFDYDALNRPATITYVDALVSYTFDEAGRLTRINDTQSTSIDWTYDDANRMLSERTLLGLVSYTYNKANQRISMTAADRPRVSYEYDTAGRQQKIVQGAETFTWAYDDLSRMKNLQRPNGVTTTYNYDAADKLNRITHANPSGVALEDLQYSHNTDNEIEAITSLTSGTLLPTAKTASAADAANRIARFDQTGYTFDEEGQTRTKTDSQGTTAYDWDARGRLTKATLPGGQTVSYNYDTLGRRVIRTANGLTTTFLYDGQDVVLDRGSGGVVTDYLNGPGIDNKLRQASAGTGALYFLQDHLGSTIALAGAGGGVVERQNYEAFGAGAGSSLTRYAYTGRDLDPEASLYYYRARYYDPRIGRFISEDPTHFDGGLNFYAYVENRPTISVDPSGLKVQKCCRDVDVNPLANFGARVIGAKHCFIKTDTLEGGMGPANAGPLPACPLGTPTRIIPHTGQSAGADCQDVPNVDEACIDTILRTQPYTGPWRLNNNCNTMADMIIRACSGCGSTGPSSPPPPPRTCGYCSMQ